MKVYTMTGTVKYTMEVTAEQIGKIMGRNITDDDVNWDTLEELFDGLEFSDVVELSMSQDVMSIGDWGGSVVAEDVNIEDAKYLD